MGRGGIDVDERCRASDGVWAIGDVTATMPFTHVGMYQARIACDDIAGEDVRAYYENGGSVPLRRSTSYCAGLSSSRHRCSVFSTHVPMCASRGVSG